MIRSPAASVSLDVRAAGEVANPMPDPESQLVSLLSQSAAGDEAAFAQLYDATRRRIFGLALRILRDRGAAEDAALEAYATVWLRAADYDSSKGAPMTWMLAVVRSKAIDLLRGRRRRNEKEEAMVPGLRLLDPEPSPEVATERAERGSRVRSALEALPRDQRVAIEAAYFGGLSYSEVATALGAPVGTVKSRIRLGLSSLRQRLGEVG